MQPVSQHLIDHPERPLTLLELSKAMGVSKDRIRHQAKRALALGEITQMGTTTAHGGSPAATFAPHPRFLAREEHISIGAPTATSTSENEHQSNARVMAFIAQSLSGLPPIPANVKILLEKRKIEHNLQKVAC